MSTDIRAYIGLLAYVGVAIIIVYLAALAVG